MCVCVCVCVCINTYIHTYIGRPPNRHTFKPMTASNLSVSIFKFNCKLLKEIPPFLSHLLLSLSLSLFSSLSLSLLLWTRIGSEICIQFCFVCTVDVDVSVFRPVIVYRGQTPAYNTLYQWLLYVIVPKLYNVIERKH